MEDEDEEGEDIIIDGGYPKVIGKIKINYISNNPFTVKMLFRKRLNY